MVTSDFELIDNNINKQIGKAAKAFYLHGTNTSTLPLLTKTNYQ